MEFFQVTEKVIYFRNEGELLKIEGWGKNSLRVLGIQWTEKIKNKLK